MTLVAEITRILEINVHHDPHSGKFASTGGRAAKVSATVASTSAVIAAGGHSGHEVSSLKHGGVSVYHSDADVMAEIHRTLEKHGARVEVMTSREIHVKHLGTKPASSTGKSPITPEAHKYVGDANKGTIEGMDHPKVQAASKFLFGREITHAEVRSLACAPEAAHVTISSDKNGHLLQIQMTMSSGPDDPYAGAGGRSERVIGMGQDNKAFMTNNSLYLSSSAPRGVGTALFARQVDTASHLGVSYIGTVAAGDPKSKQHNGYYTWARLGYEAKLSPLANAPGGAKSLNELMIRGGKDWWKTNGGSFMGKFDLTEGSTSRRILDAYVGGK